uniref:MATH domain and coiled-coil domain-containing protein n=1 Tax=Noccaea caerulescens TaxID=107243 RepID=A0A1J3IW20_NOCCA
MGIMSLEGTIKDRAKNSSNAHFMLIDGMSKLMSENFKSCHSLEFYASDLKWKLIVRSDTVKGSVSFYLWITDSRCVGSNWEVTCSYTLSVVSQTGGPNICKPFTLAFNAKQDSWGYHSFITHEVLKKDGYLVNDRTVFSAEITEVKPKFLDVTGLSRNIGRAERLKLTEVSRNNSKFTWKISQFSSFDGEHHSSHEFTVGPRRWYLQMYPKGTSDGAGNSISLFLHASDYVTDVPKEATTAIYKLRVLDQRPKRNHREFNLEHQFSSNSCWGFSKMLPLEELHNASNGYLVNDEIYLGVEFLFISTSEFLEFF